MLWSGADDRGIRHCHRRRRNIAVCVLAECLNPLSPVGPWELMHTGQRRLLSTVDQRLHSNVHSRRSHVHFSADVLCPWEIR